MFISFITKLKFEKFICRYRKMYKSEWDKERDMWEECASGRVPSLKLPCPQWHVTFAASMCDNIHMQYCQSRKVLCPEFFIESSLPRYD